MVSQMNKQKKLSQLYELSKEILSEPFFKNYIWLLSGYVAVFCILRIIFFLLMRESTQYSTTLSPDSLFLGLPARSLLRSFFLGLRMDIAISTFLTGPIYLLLWLAWLCLPRYSLWRMAGQCYLVLINIALMVLLLAEFPLYTETCTKLNVLAISFCKWPSYMLGQIFGAVHFYKILPPLLVLLFFVAKWSAEIAGRIYRFEKRRPRAEWGAFILTAFIICLFIRGNLQATPISPQDAYFSENNFLNQTTANGIYNLAYSLDFFPFKPKEQPFEINNAAELIRNFEIYDDTAPQEIFRMKPYEKPNIVIVMMESFASRIGALGETPSYSPYFDEFSKKGVLFTAFYANCIGSGRALISTLSSFPFPPFGDNIARLKAPSLATYLKPHGYNSLFFCVSNSEENMGIYLRNNDFDKIFDAPSLQHSTGVPKVQFDDELFDAADTVMRRSRQPFLSVIFTATNHNALENPPQRFPGGKMERHELAFRYADWALIRYLRKAQASNYYHNTIFVLVADHTPRYLINNECREDKFRIPLLIYSPLITNPHIEPIIASQIDIAPTILRLCKLPPNMGQTSFFGTSLSARIKNPAAYFSNREFALFGVVTPGQTFVENLSQEEANSYYASLLAYKGDPDKKKYIYYAKAMLHATKFFYSNNNISDWSRLKHVVMTPSHPKTPTELPHR